MDPMTPPVEGDEAETPVHTDGDDAETTPIVPPMTDGDEAPAAPEVPAATDEVA